MGYILLELDTTPPQLDIHAPNYTTRSALTPVTIESNEKLAPYQEIYLVDAEGVSHELTFAHKGHMLMGELYLTDFPLGIATLFVRLKDEVDNVSDLYSHSFVVLDSEVLSAVMQVGVRKQQMAAVTMQTTMGEGTMKTKMVVDMP